MKLRNKKTGDVVEVLTGSIEVNVLKDHEDISGYYTSIAQLNKEWEDFPDEPKETYYIDCDGEIFVPVRLNQYELDMMEKIGNFFNTREEAEEAVEKLKAWKRLKEIGFRFIGKTRDYKPNKHFGSVFFETSEDILNIYKDTTEFYDDLDLLFGGDDD